jgi:hypothetical protein
MNNKINAMWRDAVRKHIADMPAAELQALVAETRPDPNAPSPKETAAEAFRQFLNPTATKDYDD